jgi:hypothetical protein
MTSGRRSAAMARTMPSPPAIVVLSVGAVLAACSMGMPSSPRIEGPADPDARIRPDLIVAEPLRVVRGDVLSLRFPTETTRGVHFVLERRAGASWRYEYDLVSDGPGPGWRREWRPASDGEFAIPAIGVGGSGPDRVVIPEVAAPGQWRICTGNAGENICTEIEIVAP